MMSASHSILVSIVLLLTLFFVSGIYKFSTTDVYVDLLRQRTGASEDLCRFLIVCAGLLQIVAPLLLVAFHGSAVFMTPHPLLRALAVLGCAGLVVFALLATYLFKLPKLSASKPWPFLSNLSIAGGLALLAERTAAA